MPKESFPLNDSPEKKVVLSKTDILTPEAFDKLRSMTSEQREKLLHSVIGSFDNEDGKVAELLETFQCIMDNTDGFETVSQDKHTILLSFFPMANVLDELKKFGRDTDGLLQQAVLKFVSCARARITRGSLLTIHRNGDTIHAFVVDMPIIKNNGILECNLTETSLSDSGEPRADVKVDGKQPYSINLLDFAVTVQKNFNYE